jgi:hypothetical protein
MTYWEYQLVKDTDFMDEQFWESMPYPLLFKTKYFKILEKLEYVTFYKLMNAQKLSFKQMEQLCQNLEDDDYSAPSILMDEVAMFISLIKDTL